MYTFLIVSFIYEHTFEGTFNEQLHLIIQLKQNYLIDVDQNIRKQNGLLY